MPVPVNTFVSSAITVTPFLPKNDWVEAVIVRPNAITDVLVENVAVVRPVFAKAPPPPILNTDEFIVIDVKLPEFWKQRSPMLVTEDGNVIDFKAVHTKASDPMLVTED